MRSFMREKKIYCGKHYREVDIYPYTAAQLTASTRGKRSKKIKETEPKQKNLNDKNARRYFTQKQLDALQREIAALEDTTADRQMELEKSSYKVNMQTVIKASAFDRAMKLEAELNKIHGRIIKLLDSIKGYEMESRRLRLEERKYNLAKQKLSGAFDVDPETGEIIDEVDDPCGDPEI